MEEAVRPALNSAGGLSWRADASAWDLAHLPSPPRRYVFLLSVTARFPASPSAGPKNTGIPESPPGNQHSNCLVALPTHPSPPLPHCAGTCLLLPLLPCTFPGTDPPCTYSGQRTGLWPPGIRHARTWDIHVPKSHLSCAWQAES